ncbi:inositol polyphosphate 1-phosphatase-like [Saccoglossus kowalevskii]|uniref:inositol-1,4-bisphosphate 1-phosphatase n=1 Tax=Saccoglossus kowalevskii TaxID=10224 RepID=A0ABM0GNJ4_SACKO|nr:PREDICTED: inositol polyphosphate 1-phosphatase-like [Saccoglossus kowalevskii]
MADFLRSLVAVSEKSANLARAIRSEQTLFELLVEEKTGEAKNKRFIQDFKTLADVLIQEMVRHEIGTKFPSMRDHIYGEEDNTFTNTLGETITVGVKATKEETSTLLSIALDGNTAAADILASVIHEDIQHVEDEKVQSCNLDIEVSSLAVWIDPIDSTAEYIKGVSDAVDVNGIYAEGLQCVTVLIGVYDMTTGLPVIGVINQPFQFYDSTTLKWRGRYVWGVAYNGVQRNSYPDTHAKHNKRLNLLTVLSPSEKQPVKSAVVSLPNGTIQYGSGAGYKALCVTDKFADLYILNRNTTFKWDCCAPHAVIRSMGGGMLDLKKAMKLSANDPLSNSDILYHKPDVLEWTPGQKWSNSGGVLVYWSEDTARKAISALVRHLKSS